MKKIQAVALFLLCMVLLCCSGCGGKQQVAVDTLLAIDSTGAGSRTVTCHFGEAGLDADSIGQLDALINQYCPKMLTYTKQEESNGACYIFTLAFSSYQDYLDQITQLLGRKPVIIFSTPDNVFTAGSRISEDFSSSQLFSWLYAGISLEEQQGKLSPQFTDGATAVSLNGRTQTTGSHIELNHTEGYPLDDIFIDTVNNADGTFDRTITFRIPLITVHELGDDLISYMNARTAPEAVSAQWTDFSSGREYQVVFQGLDLNTLTRCTNLLFNSHLSGELSFTEALPDSGPLVDSSLFEETLDLSSYTAQGRKDLPVRYRYSTKSSRTVAKGETYREGTWSQKGAVNDGVYQYEGRASMLDIRVTEETIHQATGVTIALSCLGEGRFQRTVDFLFAPTDIPGVQYALQSLQAKQSGAQVEQTTSNEGLVCRVTTSGTAEEISSVMTALLGEGNAMKYQSSGNAVQVHYNTQLTDSIRMGSLFTGVNRSTPITYRIQTNGKEQLNDLYYQSETQSSRVSLQQGQDGAVQFLLDSGDTVITYNGNVSNLLGIILVFFVVLLILVGVIVIIYLIRKRSGPTPPKSSGRKPFSPHISEESLEDILADI